MENQNEDQTSTSSTSTSSGVPVEHIYFDGSQLSTASAASGSNGSDTDQVSNGPGDVVAPLGTSVIGDINCEEDTEIRQQEPQVNGNQLPVCSGPQQSEHEDVSLKQPQDGEKKSEHRCILCKINVLVFGCCHITAHDECLHARDLSLSNCNCFQREKTIKGIDYPDTPTSKRKQPVNDDDLSETWEDHPLQTHEQHSKVESLFCYLCNTEEVLIMPPCCEAHYHYHCIDQYIEKGFTICPHCQGPLQPTPQMNGPLRPPPGNRNGGGGDDSGSNGEGVGIGGGGAAGEGGGGEGVGGGAAGGAAEGASGGASGGGGRGHHGRRVGVNALGENNPRGGADIQGGGDGEGESENMEGDEDDPGGGRDDDGGGGGSAGGSPLPSDPPLDLLFQQLLLLGMSPLLFPPPADDRDEEEYYERRVDDQDHYEGEEY